MSTTEQDIRWEQRFANFCKALTKLQEGIEQIETVWVDDNKMSLLVEGLIQRFEFTHELAWKVIKDYANYQGSNSIMGSRDATRYGLRVGLIHDELWMDMINSRNITSHCYDEMRAVKVYRTIVKDYLQLLLNFEKSMIQLKSEM